MAEGGFNAVLRDLDSIEVHREDTLSGGAYLNDPALVDVLVREAPERLRDLVRWGAVFDVTDDRQVAQRPFGGQRFPRTCYAGDRTGHEIMMTLLDRLDATDTQLYNEVTVVDLVKDENGAVAGAIALDREGEVILFRSDATVLATGGGTQIYDISTNSAAGTGDGFAMAYRAGAELIDMEMVQFHPTGAVYPYDARGRLVTEAVRGEGGLLLNARRERFMKRYDPDRMELSTRDVVARAIATEVLEGRGTKRGGVYLDVTHLPAERIETRLPVMLEQFLAFGVDIRKEPMEVAPTAHHIMGGPGSPQSAGRPSRALRLREVAGGARQTASAGTRLLIPRSSEAGRVAGSRRNGGRIDEAWVEGNPVARRLLRGGDKPRCGQEGPETHDVEPGRDLQELARPCDGAYERQEACRPPALRSIDCEHPGVLHGQEHVHHGIPDHQVRPAATREPGGSRQER